MYRMQMTYKSDYPNQVHQLNLSISQNHYLLKNGEIKYQIKKFDVNWKNYQQSGKKHLVNFLIRDHFSNCFYAEIHSIDKMPHIKDFLFNTWRKKDNYDFCGFPDTLILGKHIIEKFPEIKNLEKNIGINLQLATSGFTTGIRSLRDWENEIKFVTAIYTDCQSIKDFQNNNEFICREINSKDTEKTEPNLLKWSNNISKVRLINDKKEFDKFFK